MCDTVISIDDRPLQLNACAATVRKSREVQIFQHRTLTFLPFISFTVYEVTIRTAANGALFGLKMISFPLNRVEGRDAARQGTRTYSNEYKV